MFRLPTITIATMLAGLLCQCSNSNSLDILIVNATVYDGFHTEPQSLMIGIRADTIALIANNDEPLPTAKQIIDAAGYVLSPGFIDPHTHAMDDLSDSLKRANLNYLLQGVTTVVTGSDGNSDNFIAKRLTEWEQQGIGTNAAIMVGHRNIRRSAMGMAQRVPTAEELANMQTLVTRGMEAGALGFSSGLYYAPASFANTEEVIALAKISAAYNGIYDAHIRDESTYNIGVLAAIEESIHIAEEAGLPANISHIKCLGVDVWGLSDTIVQTVTAARERGVIITADQYPYRASGTHLTAALLPKWAFADGEYQEKLALASERARIALAVTENIRRRGGPTSLLLIKATETELEGQTLAQIADNSALSPTETALAIMEKGDAAVASFNMNTEDLHHFMQQDWVMTCSDGTNAHPRKYGSFPRKIRQFVLADSVLSLGQMIRQSSGFTAQVFGIKRRGQIKEGYYADLLLFQPDSVLDVATYTEPNLLSTGIDYIVLNGELVVKEGMYQGQFAGQVVRRED